MENRVIPIFPLPMVQFPGALTPLHIFEPRYRKLLKDVMEGDKIFGIIYRNEETTTDSERLPEGSVGCSVEVAVVHALPDGRSNILCVGVTRYRLLNYIEGEPYFQAEVEFFDDDPVFDDLTTHTERAKRLFRRLLTANRKLKDETERESGEGPDLPDDDQSLSFIVTAYIVDIEARKKQDLLELTDTAQRLRQVNEILEKLAKDYEYRAAIYQLTRTNGHGGSLPKPRDEG
jgi:ATP-dependent Lon protease